MSKRHTKMKSAWDACVEAGVPPPREVACYLERRENGRSEVMAQEDRTPVAYCYARVSSVGQAREGWSLPEQSERMEKYYHYSLEDKGVAFGGVFEDPAKSGFKTFSDRAGGAAITERLKRGDHVLMVSYSRGFRNFLDAVNTFERWIEMGVQLHLLDMNIDTSTIWGRTFIRLMAVMAASERELVGERTKMALEHRKKKVGSYCNTNGAGPKIGFSWAGPKGNKYLVACPSERKQMALIVELRDEKKFTWEAIFWHFFKNGIRRRQPGPRRVGSRASGWTKDKNREWTFQAIHSAYKAEKRLQELEKNGTTAESPTIPGSSS